MTTYVDLLPELKALVRRAIGWEWSLLALTCKEEHEAEDAPPMCALEPVSMGNEAQCRWFIEEYGPHLTPRAWEFIAHDALAWTPRPWLALLAFDHVPPTSSHLQLLVTRMLIFGTHFASEVAIRYDMARLGLLETSAAYILKMATRSDAQLRALRDVGIFDKYVSAIICAVKGCENGRLGRGDCLECKRCYCIEHYAAHMTAFGSNVYCREHMPVHRCCMGRGCGDCGYCARDCDECCPMVGYVNWPPDDEERNLRRPRCDCRAWQCLPLALPGQRAICAHCQQFIRDEKEEMAEWGGD